mmetsp:Transcript_20050/g.76871  ORF Transcript_20050/g.76871 Transcript_20050/m.76871 type:complete len:205 (+) Transcript_20050:1265-1879(+)
MSVRSSLASLSFSLSRLSKSLFASLFVATVARSFSTVDRAAALSLLWRAAALESEERSTCAECSALAASSCLRLISDRFCALTASRSMSARRSCIRSRKFPTSRPRSSWARSPLSVAPMPPAGSFLGEPERKDPGDAAAGDRRDPPVTARGLKPTTSLTPLCDDAGPPAAGWPPSASPCSAMRCCRVAISPRKLPMSSSYWLMW